MVERVSTQWRKSAQTDALWQNLALRGWDWLLRWKPRALTWKQTYRRLDESNGAAFHVKAGRMRARSQRWADLPPMAAERNSAALARGSEGDLLVFGGRTERALATVERLSPGATEWIRAPSMATPRCCPAAAAIGEGRFLVTGGGESMYRHSKVYRTVEIYSLTGGSFPDFPQLQVARCAHSLAVAANGTVYATGGYGGGLSYLSSIEALDLSAPELGWSRVASMPEARAGSSGCLGPDHCLYIVGGGDNGTTNFSSCVKWDPRSGKWHQLASMHNPRHYFAGSFAPDGKLYVAGGFEWTAQLSSAEVYDPVADKWRLLPDLGYASSFVRALSSGRDPMAWILPGSRLDPALILPGSCLGPACILPWSCLDPAWVLPGSCLEPAWITLGSRSVLDLAWISPSRPSRVFGASVWVVADLGAHPNRQRHRYRHWHEQRQWMCGNRGGDNHGVTTKQ
eukprot:CAMPEP_0181240202 /NCGR_PEP_ID=MMETSP1096-20121128/40388_1 /TAXON_ID=156174 ORGANISM="Chrysochromulina ericina, Strain CCMP281" /NCGR_SAMPLE_ID=MMETSP1096 /ASSEMBLY_ACC=CAM_ASM_000453 /LENGTH=454 /DNA_ID=CAMNT_0023336043 /DNA_START=27 /DNA_END=1393 /DNA_ORIENTATION=-